MAKFAQYKKLITIIVILTIPIWIPIITGFIDFISSLGRIIGSYVRVIGETTICPF